MIVHLTAFSFYVLLYFIQVIGRIASNQVYLEPLDLIKAELDCHTNILLIKFSSGYGSVGISVASDSRGPQFESSHWRNFMNFFTINCIEKTKGRKKKEAGHCPLKKQISAVAQSL